MALTFDNYTVVSDKGFEAVVLAVWAKGFQQGPAGVVEICHEPFGSQMLAPQSPNEPDDALQDRCLRQSRASTSQRPSVQTDR